MFKYIRLTEDRRNDLLNQAEDFLNNGNYHSAIRCIASAMGLLKVPHDYDDLLSQQEYDHRAERNNINNFTFISNIQKILSGKKKYIIPTQPDEEIFTKKDLDKKIKKIIKTKEKEFNKEKEKWELEKQTFSTNAENNNTIENTIGENI